MGSWFVGKECYLVEFAAGWVVVVVAAGIVESTVDHMLKPTMV